MKTFLGFLAPIAFLVFIFAITHVAYQRGVAMGQFMEQLKAFDKELKRGK